MIPQLERLLKTREPASAKAGLSFIKLHNGYAHRNPKVSFIAFSGTTPFLFLKTVRVPGDNEVIKMAHDNLARAGSWMQKAQLSFRVPEPRWIESVGGFSVSAESLIDGRPLDISKPEEVATVFQYLRAWGQAGVRLSDEGLDVQAVLQGCLDGMRLADPSVRKQLEEMFARAIQNCGGPMVRLPRIPAHGDCTPSNVLVSSGLVLSLIDCDRFGDIELPMFDALSFMERVTPKKENPLKAHRVELDMQLQAVGLSKEHLSLLAFMYAVAIEWRKRLRFHPYETERLDQALLRNVSLAVAWTESL